MGGVHKGEQNVFFTIKGSLSLTGNLHLFKVMRNGPIAVVAHSKTWVCGRSLAGVVSSKPARA